MRLLQPGEFGVVVGCEHSSGVLVTVLSTDATNLEGRPSYRVRVLQACTAMNKLNGRSFTVPSGTEATIAHPNVRPLKGPDIAMPAGPVVVPVAN